MNAARNPDIFYLPDLGEGLPEAEIIEWHVQVGDSVETDQLLLTVETAKAVVEVPAPHTGQIAELCCEPGDLVATGAPLMRYQSEPGRSSEPQESRPNAASAHIQDAFSGEVSDGAAPAHAEQQKPRSDTGTVVGELKSASHLGTTDAFSIGAAPSTAALLEAHPELDPRHSGSTGASASGNGTAARKHPAATVAQPEGAEPLRGVRRQMAAAMVLAHSQVVPVTLSETIDIHAWSADSDPTLRLVKAVLAGCVASPILNAWAGGDPLSLVVKDNVDLGIAVDTEKGLFVPVLRDIQKRSNEDLRAGMARLKKDVKARTIPPQEMINATITLSNYGTLAGKFGSPIIVPPQVAIIGAGVIREEVVAWKGKPAIHKVLPISVTFDHRIATGGEAARFLKGMLDSLSSTDA